MTYHWIEVRSLRRKISGCLILDVQLQRNGTQHLCPVPFRKAMPDQERSRNNTEATPSINALQTFLLDLAFATWKLHTYAESEAKEGETSPYCDYYCT